jgi:cephalosporin hydroxylase
MNHRRWFRILVWGSAMAFLIGCSRPAEDYAKGYADGYKKGAAVDVDLVNRFILLFSDNQETTWRANKWLGVPAWQIPTDAWITQELIVEQKPDYLIETGTAHGGSALLWAMVLREVNPQGHIITIDIGDVAPEVKAMPLFKERITFLRGSSVDPLIVAKVRHRVQGKKVMVLLDALHTKEHVLAELHEYGPLVNVGSYLIAQDGVVNGHPIMPENGPGTLEAIEAFLSENGDFVPDRSRERLLLTYCPKGYLKRVR